MVAVKVWAPAARRVRVRLFPPRDERNLSPRVEGEGCWTYDLPRLDDGWWGVQDGVIAQAQPGNDYGFLLDDDETLLADPRSRRQPNGVHRASRFYADDFDWTDAGWTGHGLPDSVIYELHVGTFTEDGTFDAAIKRLDYLAELGVTHIELLPINAFNGVWNWGYDGVLWYAVHEPYGGPDGFKRLVDACHTRGLAVLLDVVYNHLGPSGNYLPRFGPYLKPGRNTWGDLINLDGEGSAPVREYILQNALGWLAEFHVDGLRLDAVHALVDSSEPHLLAELSGRVRELSGRVGRPLVLIAESDLNDPIMIRGQDEHGYGLDAQWDDDVHHSLHALLSGERQGYYDDFGTITGLAKVITRAFFHDGTFSTFRRRVHGKPIDPAATPGYRFVVCLQNHDQVGNRAVGDRLSEIVPVRLLKVGATLLLTSPFTPMLWMGEEWGASTRWPFFTSHPEPELAESTGKGRLAEFEGHGWDVSQMIDPQNPTAFRSAKLDWQEPGLAEHEQILRVYRQLLALRRTMPDLRDPRLDQVQVSFDEDERWIAIIRGALLVVANLADSRQSVPARAFDIIFATSDGVVLGPESVSMPAQCAAIVTTAASTQPA